MALLTARQFREKYAIDRGHIDWNNMVDDTRLKDINNVEDDVMEKYTQYKTKELEELLESAFDAGRDSADNIIYPNFEVWKEQVLNKLNK